MVEILIVAVLVLWSTVVVFKKVFPTASYKLLMALSNACAKRGWNSLAGWLKPAMASGCGGNCACPVNEDANQKSASQAVKWK